MTGKWANLSNRMVFAYCMLGGLILLFTPASWTSRLQLAYANVFRIPLATGRSVTLASRTSSLSTSNANAATIAQLRNDVANLRALVQDANEVISLLAKTRVEPAWGRVGLHQANLIKTGATDFTINCGQEQGVTVGQYVMALSGDHSIIGRVSDVMTHTANVRLLTAPDSRAEVQIGLSGIQGVMEGRGGDIAKIAFIPRQRAVAKGDPVYIRKDPMLDVSMVAGRVDKCVQDIEDPLLWDITVRSTCDVASLKWVAVVMMER